MPSFTEQMDCLHRRLQRPLPGPAAHRLMAPSTREDPAVSSVEDRECREAGVLAALYPRGEQPVLILTERHKDLPDHPGQISLPGGQREPDESLKDAALREANEEVALLPDEVDVLGTLTPIYIPPSGFCVYPFVGALDHVPSLAPRDAEVSAILHVPMADLLVPECRTCEDRVLRGQRVSVPFYQRNRHKIWGATAMILAELLALFRDVEETL